MIVGWLQHADDRVLVPVAVTADVMREFAGRYVFSRPDGAPINLVVSLTEGRLMASQDDGAPFELIPTGTNVFTPLGPAPPFRFERDSAGTVAALVGGGARLVRQPSTVA